MNIEVPSRIFFRLSLNFMRIIIIGGGISGLSCAHALADHDGLEVVVYEKLNNFGGQARSSAGERCSLEYAWRIFTSNYVNLLSIFEEIPTADGSVRDNLVSYGKYETVSKNKSGFFLAMQPNAWTDKSRYVAMIAKMIDAMGMTDARLESNDISFIDYMGRDDPTTVSACHEIVGPLLGLEAEKATVFSVARGFQLTYGAGDVGVYVANGPYNETIFVPWAEYLMDKGVTMKSGTMVEKLVQDGTKVTHAVLNNGESVPGDAFILALGQGQHADLLQQSCGLLSMSPTLAQSAMLREYCNNWWFSLRIYFSRKRHDVSWTCSTVVGQPWKHVILRVTETWRDEYIIPCGSQEIWLLSVIDVVPGRNGKALRDCSIEEATEETLSQLEDEHLINRQDILMVEPWEDWYNDEEGKLRNRKDEYKLSINPACRNLQPPCIIPEVGNIFVASVFVRNLTPMVSMEIACQNGLLAAQAVCKICRLPPSRPLLSLRNGLSRIFVALQSLDRVLYEHNTYIRPCIILSVVVINLLLLVVLFLVMIWRSIV